MSRWLFFLMLMMAPVGARAAVLGGCNYTLSQYSDRGSVVVFNRGGSVVMQVVLDDDLNDYTSLQMSHSTGDQARVLAKQNAQFAKAMADSHIFPADVRDVSVYIAKADSSSPSSSAPAASYYGFYGQNDVYLGGFGTVGSDWYVCDWQ